VRADLAPVVVVEATLDNLRSGDVRLLEEAARHGSLHVRVPSDRLVEQVTGSRPLFPAIERLFLAESLRWVASAAIVDRPVNLEMSGLAAQQATLIVRAEEADSAVCDAAREHGVPCHEMLPAVLAGFPVADIATPPSGVPRVVVTGCYDWLHSGHIRFFMDAAAYGALYVVVGSDENVEFLKGPGHPLQREQERRYMAGSVRSVHACLVSSGSGWMDAEPEIDDIQPAFYVVNEDGDQPEKRAFCTAHGIEYIVLQRKPHAGLPPRTSTDLRGF
jgi:cytidyltransferase-like protein